MKSLFSIFSGLERTSKIPNFNVRDVFYFVKDCYLPVVYKTEETGVDVDLVKKILSKEDSFYVVFFDEQGKAFGKLEPDAIYVFEIPRLEDVFTYAFQIIEGYEFTDYHSRDCHAYYYMLNFRISTNEVSRVMFKDSLFGVRVNKFLFKNGFLSQFKYHISQIEFKWNGFEIYYDISKEEKDFYKKIKIADFALLFANKPGLGRFKVDFDEGVFYFKDFIIPEEYRKEFYDFERKVDLLSLEPKKFFAYMFLVIDEVNKEKISMREMLKKMVEIYELFYKFLKI